MAVRSIYLVRHAIAEDVGPRAASDELRPLTEEGADRFRQQVRGLRDLDVELDAVLTSPLVRCRQTAEILAAGVAGGPPVHLVDALRPGGRQTLVMEALGGWRAARAVALVGHEPSIGALAAALLGATGAMPFKKGAICRVDVDTIPPRSAGVLAWFLPPRVLRRLGE